MIERLVRVVEMVHFTMYLCLILTTVRPYTRHARHDVWLPCQQCVQMVLRRRHLAQVLNTVVLLITIYVVNLPFWETTFADSPDGMVQTNKYLSLAQTAQHA